jgi:hypothetical protein
MKKTIRLNIYRDSDAVVAKISPDRRITIMKNSCSVEDKTPSYNLYFKRLLDSEKLTSKMIEECKKNGEIIQSTKDGKHHILHTSIRLSEEAIYTIYESIKKLE